MKRTRKDQPEKSTPAVPTPRPPVPAKTDATAASQNESAEKKRLHVFFLGSVQGVGFRYTALSIAERFAITGWVRNVSDGRVELMAEGTPNVLESYLTAVGDEMSGYIRKVDRTWEPATGEWSEFAIASSA